MTDPAPETFDIRSDDDVERALALLLEAQDSLAGLKANYNAAAAELRSSYLDFKAPFDAKVAALKKGLRTYARRRVKRWKDKTGRRSKDFVNGALKFRKEPEGVKLPKDHDALLARLRELDLAHCIAVYEKPDKNAIRLLDDATLELLGVKRTGRDRFYAVPTRTAL